MGKRANADTYAGDRVVSMPAQQSTSHTWRFVKGFIQVGVLQLGAVFSVVHVLSTLSVCRGQPQRIRSRSCLDFFSNNENLDFGDENRDWVLVYDRRRS